MANKTEVLRDVPQAPDGFNMDFRTPSQRHNQICNRAQQSGFSNPGRAKNGHDFSGTDCKADRVRERFVITDNEVRKREVCSFHKTLSTSNEKEHLFKFSLP
jgi:hypothetical protein